jgi:hypothetical protein
MIKVQVGNQYAIKESGKILLITGRNKEKDPVFTVKYEDKSKGDLLLSESQIKKHIGFGSWIKI